ncbi:MAG: tRNA lysidine(34) synthetase TilS, partial [Idiomarina sp.]|nr:tRNA lysidine(34) synthetase TilS [Idiomarina sp.]
MSIVVALGGGADSQSVLDLTLRYREEHPQHHYLAIHLDHYFHPDSPKWAEFLRQQCIQHGIAHIVEPVDVPKQGRASKEALGREARYSRMAQLTDPRAVILLGHHLSDQSETFLLQLKRGAGPKGLAAMAPIAPFTDQRLLVRPLLGLNKAQIYQYAQARKL